MSNKIYRPRGNEYEGLPEDVKAELEGGKATIQASLLYQNTITMLRGQLADKERIYSEQQRAWAKERANLLEMIEGLDKALAEAQAARGGLTAALPGGGNVT